MVQVNALGDTCPLPVIKTMNALKELGGAGTVEVLVDNEIAVQNLTRLAENKGYTIETEKRSEKEYRVTLTTGEAVERTGDEANLCTTPTEQKTVVVVISADHMGEGNDELGKILLKGFLFALTQQEKLPSTILFYNGGASLTCEGSPMLEDLKALEAEGVEILTCGTCLNFYGLTDKLQCGTIGNMYDIVETMTKAGKVITV